MVLIVQCSIWTGYSCERMYTNAIVMSAHNKKTARSQRPSVTLPMWGNVKKVAENDCELEWSSPVYKTAQQCAKAKEHNGRNPHVLAIRIFPRSNYQDLKQKNFACES